MQKFGFDFCERFQHKRSLGDAGMRDAEIFSFHDHHIIIKKNIEVDGSGRVGGASFDTPQTPLNDLELRQKIQGKK